MILIYAFAAFLFLKLEKNAITKRWKATAPQRRFLLCFTVFFSISVSQSLAIVEVLLFSLCSSSCRCAPSAKITRRSSSGCFQRRQRTCATMSKNINGAKAVFCRPFPGLEEKKTLSNCIRVHALCHSHGIRQALSEGSASVRNALDDCLI